MLEVKTEILIHQPLERVASYAANPDHAPEWYENIQFAERQNKGPLQNGNKINFKAKFLRRTLEYTYEIMDYFPGRRLVMETVNGPFPMQTTYEWREIDAHTTKMVLINRGQPSGFSKILAPFMAIAMRKANNKDLRRLKKILEKK